MNINDNTSAISTQYNDSLSSSSTMIPYSANTDSRSTYNIMQDDELIKLIKQEFNSDDMEIFELNFKIYCANENNKDGYILLMKIIKMIT